MRPPQSLTIASKQIMKRIFVYLLAGAIVLVAFGGIHTLQAQQQRIQVKSLELDNTQNKLKRTQELYNKVNNDKNATDQQVKDLNKQIEELNKQLSAKKAAQAATIAAATLNTVQTAQAASGAATGDAWAKLRQCESGGNYANKNNPNYRGAYQFGFGTWQSVGGTGDPADASPAEQDMRAQMLFNQRGWQPWECAAKVGLY